MSLPKWIETTLPHPYRNELIEALKIAWEALEELKNIRYESRAKETCDDNDYPARDAMRRIEELGR